MIIGSAIGDNRAVELERGIVRAFDARTGDAALVVGSDSARRGRSGARAAGRRDAGGADRRRERVVGPVGRRRARTWCSSRPAPPSPDFYGGERLGDNRYANSLVALRAATGELVWHRQLVHHDLWDYDVPAQPMLVDIERDGKSIPAVIQATKMGMLFVFDRETGEPSFAIVERPVPQGGGRGRAASPTQPFPAAPPPLVSHGAGDAGGRMGPDILGPLALPQADRALSLGGHLHAAQPRRARSCRRAMPAASTGAASRSTPSASW